MSADRDQQFRAFVEARGLALRQTAYLLCGDWQRADDLLQTALTKLYTAWPRARSDDGVDAYARKVLVRTVISADRWGPRRRATADQAGDWAALADLPSRQRAVVVLRYWEDLSVEETARLLGVSQGTVRSQAEKGVSTVRHQLAAVRC